VISKRCHFGRANSFPDARTALQVWLETAEQATWHFPDDIRKSFPAADMVGGLAIFNVKGNHYRLTVRMEFRNQRIYITVRMEFRNQRIYIREFLALAEYDQGAWKKWL
jgi:mRNA interferase HigB